MKLGEIVKEYRTIHKLSMEKFGELAGLSKGYISMLEKGENPQTKKPISPSFDTIKNIAIAMGKDFEELISLLDDNQTISLSVPPTLRAITETAEKLAEKRQLIVLDTAQTQLDQQTAEEEKARYEALRAPQTDVSDSIISIDDYRDRVTYPVPGEASAGSGVWAENSNHEYSFLVDLIPDEDDYDTIAKVVGHSMQPKLYDGDYLFIKLTPSVDANTIGIFQVNGENYVKKLRLDTSTYVPYLESINPDYDDIYFHEDDDIRVIGEVVDIYREG